jgi:hypothetical protein
MATFWVTRSNAFSCALPPGEAFQAAHQVE